MGDSCPPTGCFEAEGTTNQISEKLHRFCRDVLQAFVDSGASSKDTETLWDCSLIRHGQSFADRCFMVNDGDEDNELTQSKDDLLSTAASMTIFEKHKDCKQIDLIQMGPSLI